MFGHGGAADRRVRATLLDDLVITVAKFFVSVFHPNAGLIYHVR